MDMKKILHSVLYSTLWIVAGYALLVSIVNVDLSFNLFSWSPSFDWETVLHIAVIVATEVFIFWFAGKTKTISVTIVSLLVCTALIFFGAVVFSGYQKETLEQGGSGLAALVNRRELSPIWYRLSILTLFLIPLLSWGYHLFKRLIKSRNS
jgi:hypothetical protein